jgi:hypothetical protein
LKQKIPPKIHTGTNFEKFGDGFFAVFNPLDENRMMEVYTSNTASDLNNHIMFEAIFKQYQCIQVEQRKDEKSGKLKHQIKFNGNPIFTKEYDENEVFTGELQVFISDNWNRDANNLKVKRFVYESLD